MSKAPPTAEDAELSRCGGPPWETKVEASLKATPRSDSHQEKPGGPAMYEYELHHLRAAELIRRAEQERLAREAARVRRAARREAAERSGEGVREKDAHSSRRRRHRHPHAA
ncbi:hypothetical protein GCM10022233_64210 [Streptomyces shaanxiensis]|uniref:Uncharacterized protein n=2 Tax=Streptomyces shaanxiensis TaxID=653357 RepID=A0ABP7VXT1_9ACTN